MIYSEISGIKLSRLGFGTMRLPLMEDKKTIDEAQTQEMIDYAMAHGVNYFDTAAPYHDGFSEIVVGKCLSKYPRNSYYLATKYPGHQIVKHYDPAEVFEGQLRKCGVDYFDFYLLHNVSENSIGVYMDPQWNILNYFLEQKKLGRIKHLGFSTHGSVETMKKFLDYAGDYMEFCQIQINYMDWDLQDAKTKYEMLTERNIPIIAMESVRGGKLANLPDYMDAKLKALIPGDSAASWGYRWLIQHENVRVILSGLSNLEQTIDNVRTFEENKPLSDSDNALLFDIADELKNAIPCTACRYCCAGCPMELNIPDLISKINDFNVYASINISMYIESLPEEKRTGACISCGKCVKVCPQNINIPEIFQKFTKELAAKPSWAELSRQREEAALALKNKAN